MVPCLSDGVRHAIAFAHTDVRRPDLRARRDSFGRPKRPAALVVSLQSDARSRASSLVPICIVFLAALAVRYAFVVQLRDESYLGNIRVSDAFAYFELAGLIVAGNAPAEPYWQAPFYPLLLAGFQWLFGGSLGAVQWLHLLVGALNCALVFRLTDRMFSREAAWAAAGVGVLYAPFWIFDAQPLPANLTALLDLVLVSVYLRFRESGNWDLLAAAGLLLGVVITTHGLAMFTLPVFLYDIATRRRDADAQTSSVAACVAVFLAATAIAPASVSLRNSIVAKAPVFVSYNAGINLYIGNHRDLEQTLARRGGYEWWELFNSPYASGASSPADMNRYFIEQTLNEFLEAPGSVLQTFGKKTLMAVAGSEQKRNFPIYPLREDSWLLRALLFEVSIFGFVVFAFPAGLVIPLAVFGFLWVRRSGGEEIGGLSAKSLPGWIALLHVAGMLVFFPTARYRVPAIMLLLPYVGVALAMAWNGFATRSRERGDSPSGFAAVVTTGLVVFAIVNPLASNVFRHPVRDEAEHLYLSARWGLEMLWRAESESIEARMLATANESMRVDPTYPEPLELLAMHYLNRDIDRSIDYLTQLDRLIPDDAAVQSKLRKAKALRERRVRQAAAVQ